MQIQSKKNINLENDNISETSEQGHDKWVDIKKTQTKI